MTRRDEASDRLFATLDNLAEGFQIIDRDYRYFYVNESVAQHGRKSKAELLGQKMTDAYPGIENTEVFAVIRRCMEDRTGASLVNEFVFADGQKGWFELRIQPCPEGVYILSTDITEKRKLEAQLRQAQKMEALGQLAGGIAHDFGNVLTAITSFTTFAAESVAPDHPARQDLAQVSAAAARAGALTRKLLTFSRSGALDPRRIDVNETIASVDPMLRVLLGDRVELATVVRPGTWPVVLDPNALEQVVMNLVLNARDAMPAGGAVTIETANVSLEEAHLSARGETVLAAGDYVQVAVSDTGTGMTAEVRERLFEPFFTTKGAGRGTGLGLSICFGIVRQANGWIWVYSEPGRGTTFKVYLPRAPGGKPAALATLAAPPAQRAVLVVDDDAQVRALARRALERAGFEVRDASGVQQALDAARRAAALHLLLSDVMMGTASGPEVAAKIAPLHPEARVLYMSGYAESAAVRGRMLEPGTKMLSKPFTPASLVSKVVEVLEQR